MVLRRLAAIGGRNRLLLPSDAGYEEAVACAERTGVKVSSAASRRPLAVREGIDGPSKLSLGGWKAPKPYDTAKR